MTTINADRSGYVYVLNAIGTPFFKIGCTADVDRRLSQVGLLLPYKLDVMTDYPAENMYAEERRLHQKFARKRVRGEWFRLSLEDQCYLHKEAIAANVKAYLEVWAGEGLSQPELREKFDELMTEMKVVFFSTHQELVGNDYVI